MQWFSIRVGRRRRDIDGDGQGREVCEPCQEVSWEDLEEEKDEEYEDDGDDDDDGV